MIRTIFNIFTVLEIVFITVALIGVLYDYCRDRLCIGSTVSDI